jgi:hypothetical protein
LGRSWSIDSPLACFVLKDIIKGTAGKIKEKK